MSQNSKAPRYIDDFPYMSTRLCPVDYKSIIKKGEKWNDPEFPHGPQALFINERYHSSNEDMWKYRPDKAFYWRRASDHFKEKNWDFKVYDGIDPTDIIQGKLANCYFLASLAGLAEDPPDIAHHKLGLRVADNFLVNEVNQAGCYAI